MGPTCSVSAEHRVRWGLSLLLALLSPALGCGSSPSAARVHPAGYGAGTVHGADLKRQATDCRACHGEDLAGGTSGVSCDTCHTPSDPTAWRTRCTFCHGGGADQTGAPPRNLDGTAEAAAGVFPPHTAHVRGGVAAPYDCVQCHVKATDVLSPGHVFDGTPGKAETDFGASLSKQTLWQGGVCTNTYCHGAGRTDDGAVAATAGPRGCGGCHAGPTDTARWAQMSGAHEVHLGAGVSCVDCHRPVTTDGTTIADPAKHVNRQVELDVTQAGLTLDPAALTCTGTCHGHGHAKTGWPVAGGRYHPQGWAAPTSHGPDLELGRQDCRGCHGQDLKGATGPSCDSCHKPGWRTQCTYCHGGGANQTGAPPRDLAAQAASASQSFVAHTKHVTQGVAAASDCVQCHKKPTDALTDGHVFDATRGVAEVSLAGGLSAAGTYDGKGTCAATYCHGNGRGDNGTIKDGAAPLSCAGCHPGMASAALWATMSGDHRRHLREPGITCGDCHRTVTTNGTTIANPALHVNKQREVAFSAGGFTYNAGNRRCTGSCHGENHNNQTW